VLCDGDALVCGNNAIVLVRAASESLTEASSDDPLLLLRAAYHLGNRHVSLQILPGRCASRATTCSRKCSRAWA
jgi:urease accessory protein